MHSVLLFDIDGTLLRCGPAPREAMELAFSDIYKIPGKWDFVRMAGRSDRAIIRDIAHQLLKRSISEEELKELCEAYIKELDLLMPKSEDYELLPGIPALLEKLEQNGSMLMGLQTGNLEGSARIKLERGKLNKYFSFGGFGSDHEDRNDIVDVALERARKILKVAENDAFNAYVIGDTAKDMSAGKAHGAKTVGVLTSLDYQDELRASQPDHLLDDLSDLDGFLNNVL